MKKKIILPILATTMTASSLGAAVACSCNKSKDPVATDRISADGEKGKTVDRIDKIAEYSFKYDGTSGTDVKVEILSTGSKKLNIKCLTESIKVDSSMKFTIRVKVDQALPNDPVEQEFSISFSYKDAKDSKESKQSFASYKIGIPSIEKNDVTLEGSSEKTSDDNQKTNFIFVLTNKITSKYAWDISVNKIGSSPDVDMVVDQATISSDMSKMTLPVSLTKSGDIPLQEDEYVEFKALVSVKYGDDQIINKEFALKLKYKHEHKVLPLECLDINENTKTLVGLNCDDTVLRQCDTIKIPGNVVEIRKMFADKPMEYHPLDTIKYIQFDESNVPLVIEEDAFWGFDKLVEIQLPSRLWYIGENAFYDCENLKIIDVRSWASKFDNENNPFGSENLFSRLPQTGKVLYPEGYELQAYYTFIVAGLSEGWFGEYKLTTKQEGIFKIGTVEGYDSEKILLGLWDESVEIPEETVQIPNDITIIAPGAFNGAFPEGKEIKVMFPANGSSVSVYGYAFANNPGLKYVVVPENSNITKFDFACFSNCVNLESISFSSFIETFGNWCFNNCLSLKSITIQGTIANRVPIGMFYGCKSLTSIPFADETEHPKEYIGALAFYGTGITNINIASHVKYIGYEAFKNTPATSLSFDGSATGDAPQLFFIGENAFKGLNITSDITIPKSVSYIGFGAFAGIDANILVDSNNPYYINENNYLYDKSLGDNKLIIIRAPRSTNSKPNTNVIQIAPYAYAGLSIRDSDGIQFDFSETNLETIYEAAFADTHFYTSLTKEVKFPASLKTIGDFAFRSFQGKIDFTGLINLESIGDEAFTISIFESDTGVLDLSKCAKLKKIGNRAFFASNVTELHLSPATVEYGEMVFSRCDISVIDLTGFETAPSYPWIIKVEANQTLRDVVSNGKFVFPNESEEEEQERWEFFLVNKLGMPKNKFAAWEKTYPVK